MTEATALTDRELDAYLAEHLFRHRMIDAAEAARVTWDGTGLVIEAMRERGYGVVVSALSTGEFHVLIAKDADIDWLTDDYAHESASLPRAVAEAAAAAIQAEEAGA